jgi:hypothetical protein
MKRDFPSGFVAQIGLATAKKQAEAQTDPDVKLPADVRDTVTRGEAAFRRSKRKLKRRKINKNSPRDSAAVPNFVISVVGKAAQDSRDAALEALTQQSRGKRGQPPMLDRLPVVRTIVDRLLSEGVRFATGRNSQMNRLVRDWLNDRAVSSVDPRKSRRKQLTADAVQQLLKQIKELG